MNSSELTNITNALSTACISGNPKIFIPYLLSNNVKTGTNKVRFYKFFKELIICSQTNSYGKLFLKIENPAYEEDKGIKYYNFYDDHHQYSRISILTKELDNSIFVDALPF